MPGHQELARPEFHKRLQSIETLLSRIDHSGDPSLKSDVRELVQLVMDLHGAGLERILELAGDDGLAQKMGQDDLVGSLLILYGIHPQPFEERIAQALDKVRPRLRSREGKVDLLSTEDGAVHLRLRANGHGCGSTAQALKEIVEGALYGAVPDITSLVIDGAEDSRQGFVPLEMLQASVAPALVLTATEKV
jgi:Fe-S cluster biogenesis protein NfuA